MAGNIFLKERAILTLQDRTNTGALANLSGLAAATADLDVRTAGNAAGDMAAGFELLLRWATITGILYGVPVAELYLVPLFDGTNLPDVDLTAGASHVSPTSRMGVFVASKQAVTATDLRLSLGPVPLMPVLYRAYIINTSGQTVTTTSGTSWQLRALTYQAQYT